MAQHRRLVKAASEMTIDFERRVAEREFARRDATLRSAPDSSQTRSMRKFLRLSSAATKNIAASRTRFLLARRSEMRLGMRRPPLSMTIRFIRVRTEGTHGAYSGRKFPTA